MMVDDRKGVGTMISETQAFYSSPLSVHVSPNTIKSATVKTRSIKSEAELEDY